MSRGTARALLGEGEYVKAISIRGWVRRIEHLQLPPGGPLTEDEPEVACYGVVRKGNYFTKWWWFCECGRTSMSHQMSWEQAYRGAYLHVRLSRYMKEKEVRGSDCE